MEPGEALTTAAQIAVALAGFAGVVVTFRSKSLHEWSQRDRFRLWLLLGNALVPLFDCFFGMFLMTIKPTPLFIWNWCKRVLASFGFSFWFFDVATPIRTGADGNQEYGGLPLSFLSARHSGHSGRCLAGYNALVSGVFSFFYAAVIFPLAIGTLQFALMILLPPHTSET